MFKRSAVFLSISANVILAFAVAFLLRTKFSRPAETISVVTNFVARATAQNISPEMPPTETNSASVAFHWGEIESEDYPTYIANLRRVNCPEKTIRHILIPDINELYEKRRGELQITLQTNFWIGGRARAALVREGKCQATALDVEESALIHQLLGVDWVRKDRQRGGFFNEWLSVGLPYMLTPSLSMEKTKEVFDLLQKFFPFQKNLMDETGGIVLPEDEAKLKKLSEQLWSEVKQLMPAQEFDEMNLRLVAVEYFELLDGLKDSPLTLSPEDLQKLAALQHEGNKNSGYDIFSRLSGIRPPEEDSFPTREQKNEIEQSVKSFLGEARYEMFQEATDPSFRAAKQFVEAQQLPKQTSRALFEVQQAAQDQAAQIRADPSLHGLERKRALREIRASTEAALGGMLDAKTWQTYQNHQGNGWLDDISKKLK